MANTYSLKNVSAVTDSVVMTLLDRTNMAETDRQSTVDDRTGYQTYSATYALASGEPDEPMKVSLTIRVDPKANSGDGETVVTAKIITPLVVTNAASEEILRNDVVCSVTIKSPSNVPVPHSSDYLKLGMMTLSALFDSVDGSDLATTDVMDQLRYGIATINS
jgi:hypothetical protein